MLNSRRRCLQKQRIFIVHAPAAVEKLAHFDPSLCVTAPTRAGRNVQDHSARRTALSLPTVASERKLQLPQKLLLEGPVLVITTKDPMPIHVNGHRNASLVGSLLGKPNNSERLPLEANTPWSNAHVASSITAIKLHTRLGSPQTNDSGYHPTTKGLLLALSCPASCIPP